MDRLKLDNIESSIQHYNDVRLRDRFLAVGGGAFTVGAAVAEGLTLASDGPLIAKILEGVVIAGGALLTLNRGDAARDSSVAIHELGKDRFRPDALYVNYGYMEYMEDPN